MSDVSFLVPEARLGDSCRRQARQWLADVRFAPKSDQSEADFRAAFDYFREFKR
jgi:hypothetical protein